MGFLSRMFKRRDWLTKASRSGDPEAFVRVLMESDIWLLLAQDGEGIDPASLTAENLVAEMERQVKELAERQDFPVFMYGDGRLTAVPFFSSEAMAEPFVGEFCRARNRVIGFQSISVKGATLLSLLNEADRFVINDGSNDGRALTEEEMAILRRLAAGAQ